MIVKKVNLGNGLFRFELTPTVFHENVDFIPFQMMLKNDLFVNETEEDECTCCNKHINKCENHSKCKNEECRHTSEELFNNEPSYIDAHIVKPLRKNFDSYHDWALAIEKYHAVEDAINNCDWLFNEQFKPSECHQTSNCDNACYSKQFSFENDGCKDYGFDECDSELKEMTNIDLHSATRQGLIDLGLKMGLGSEIDVFNSSRGELIDYLSNKVNDSVRDECNVVKEEDENPKIRIIERIIDELKENKKAREKIKQLFEL